MRLSILGPYKQSYYRIFGLPGDLLCSPYRSFERFKDGAIKRLSLIAKWAYIYSCDGLAAMQLSMMNREEVRDCLVKDLLEDIAHHLGIDLISLAKMTEQIASELEQREMVDPSVTVEYVANERALAGAISAITGNLNQGLHPRTQLAAA